MRITAIAVGTRMPDWVDQGVQTYLQRLPRHVDLRIHELAAAPRRSGSTAASQRSKEGDAMLKVLDASAYVVALDERGTGWTSTELAAQLEYWQAEQPRVALLIGGADGLDERCKARADKTWSLSPLTLPHALVRVVLAEQIYRAWTLLQGHPYHRD